MGEDICENTSLMSTIDLELEKCDCTDRSTVREYNEPLRFTFAINQPPRYKTVCDQQ